MRMVVVEAPGIEACEALVNATVTLTANDSLAERYLMLILLKKSKPLLNVGLHGGQR